MELKMKPYSTPEVRKFNYEELKAELIEKTALYETIVYTDDQVKKAKEDRANLNRLKKALNDERIRQEREYMEPFATFKAQINEIIGIIDKPLQVIDKQVKAFEEQQKAEKRELIEGYWHEVLAEEKVPAAVCFSHIFDEKWLNASVTMKTIQKAIDDKLVKIAEDLAVVRSLPAYAFEAEECYIDTLDLARAVSEAHRLQEMAQRKAEYEALQAAKNAVTEAAKSAEQKGQEAIEAFQEAGLLPKREWIAFQALLSPDEARALGQYMKSNGIRYKAV